MSWSEAVNYCKSVGAKLVEINSEYENAAIVGEIDRLGYTERLMYFWIGVTDQKREGIWKLASSGERAQYLNWDRRTSEPNNYVGEHYEGEDCAFLRAGGCREWDHSHWADVYCWKNVLPITCPTLGSMTTYYTMNVLCEFETELVELTTTPKPDGPDSTNEPIEQIDSGELVAKSFNLSRDPLFQ